MDEQSKIRHEEGFGQEHVESVWGGSSLDVEKSILETTAVSSRLLGQTIVTVGTEAANLGADGLDKITLHLSNGTRLVITGSMEIDDQLRLEDQ